MTVWKARFLNFPLDFPLHMKKNSIIVSQTDTLRGKVFPLHRKEYPMMHFSDCTLSSKGFFSIYTVKNFFNYFQDWHPKEQGRPFVASTTSSIFPLYMLKNYIFSQTEEQGRPKPPRLVFFLYILTQSKSKPQ